MTASELRRMEQVRRARLLDTPAESAFDRITALAVDVFDVPIALVTVVDENRIWFKSRMGLGVEEIDREPGLCASAILQDDPWVVEDARNDDRTRANSLVTGDVGLQFYAGAPLRSREGGALGTLCLIDGEPRTFSADQRRLLADLAGLVVDIIALRAGALGAISMAHAAAESDAASSRELQRELERRRRSEEAQGLLADATATLLRDEDLATALGAVCERALPLLGQGVALSRIDELGFRTTHVASVDPAAVAILGKASDASEEVNLDDTPAVLDHVFRTAEPLLCTVEEALTWPGMPEAPGLREALEQLGVFQFLLVPLLVRDRAVGSLSFLATEPGWTYDDGHVSTAVDLAARMGAAIENARLHDIEVDIADALQRSLLPAVLPVIPGVELAGRYRAAGPADIGGDFYDVFGNDGSTWTLLLGDVSGKGPEAAAIAGLARYTARALALTDTSPEQILRLMNVAVERQSTASRFLTALCATFHTDGNGLLVDIADAGHMPPLVRRADGTVETIDLRGTILGMFPEATIAATSLRLGPGDALVAYTDGATDARNATGDFLGVGGLATVLGDIRLRRPANIAQRLVEAVSAFDGGTPQDDLAILVLRVADEHP